MNREIKFRIWDITCKTWLSNFVIYQYGNVSSNGVWLQSNETHIMQYSGCKDICGNEIYEDDIVENDNNGQFQVMFYDGRFFCHKLCELTSGDISEQNLKVVGNIYDNKLK